MVSNVAPNATTRLAVAMKMVNYLHAHATAAATISDTGSRRAEKKAVHRHFGSPEWQKSFDGERSAGLPITLADRGM